MNFKIIFSFRSFKLLFFEKCLNSFDFENAFDLNLNFEFKFKYAEKKLQILVYFPSIAQLVFDPIVLAGQLVFLFSFLISLPS
jgi:hypothetical protein